MIIIKFFSSYCDDKIVHLKYITMDKLNDDPDYNVKYRFTTKNDFTHVIILNTAKPDIRHIPKKNIIGIVFFSFYFHRYLKLANR